MELISSYLGGKAGLYADLQRQRAKASLRIASPCLALDQVVPLSSRHPKPTGRGRGCLPGKASPAARAGQRADHQSARPSAPLILAAQPIRTAGRRSVI